MSALPDDTSPAPSASLQAQLRRLSPQQRALFERRLAAQRQAAAGAAAIPRRAGDAPAPLSSAQQRLWFLQRLEPHSSAYNVASVLRLRGALDVAALQAALRGLIERHELLRTAYPAAGALTVQRLQPVPAQPLQQHALGAAEAAAFVQTLAQQPFDLAEVPLRLALLRHGAHDHRLVIVSHHIASDRWSVAVFLRELSLLYAAAAARRPSPLPPLAIQYADWAAWQQSQLAGAETERLAAYWRDRLGGELPLLALPLDHPRPPLATDAGAQHALAWPRELGLALKALARARQVTLFMLLLAAFKLWLHRISGSDDILVGTEVANRDRPETEPLIGLLVNTLVLRTQLPGGHDLRFGALLAQVRSGFLDALAHQALPFEKLVELLNPQRRLDLMTPLFQAKFDLQPAPPPAAAMAGVALAREALPETRTKYELRLNLVDADDGLRGQIEYRADLFEPATIAAMARQLEVLLGAIVAAPDAPIAALPLLDAAERAAVLGLGRPGGARWDGSATIDALVFAQAARTPEATALIDGDERWSYARLAAAAAALAARLGDAACAPVGVCMPRSARLVAALLGVMRAGAAYVPLDPEYPAARLDFIVRDAGLRCVLVDALAPAPPLAAAQALRLLPVDGSEAAPALAAVPPRDPRTLAYLIYTSGSTGVPKGVAIEHRNAVAMLRWAHARFGAALDGMLASTSMCFDLSVFELFAPLAHGGRVVIADNLMALPRLPAAAELRFVNTVPSLLQQLLDGAGLPAGVRTVALAGEPLPPALVERLRRLPQIDAVHNLYGPSEDTTYSTDARYAGLHGAEPAGPLRRVGIGLPLPGSQAYVVDSYGEPVPRGVAGELWLAGQGVARGYLGRPALTAERFAPNPFDAGGQDPLVYRTGDRVRFGADGQLEFLGRLDHQVKIRGFRIETGEIEHALREHAAVRDAVVQAGAGADGQRRLVAHVEGSADADAAALRAWLAERLPAQLVPARLVVGSLPRLPNGKLDRGALAARSAQAEALPADGAAAPPRTALQQRLAVIWQQALKRDAPPGVDDDFFALGGHSLLAIDIGARIEQAFGRTLPLRALFEAPTIAQLALRLDAATAEAAPRPLIEPDPAGAHQPFALTDIQQAYLLGRHAAFELGRVSTHGYREIELGGVAPAAVAPALDRLVQRHGMLRAVVTGDGRQRVLPEVPPVTIAEHDLRAVPDPQAALLAVRERLREQRFEPTQWPLFHLEASCLPGIPERWRYHLSFDVLIGDAFSFQLLGRELAALLQGRTLAALELSFRDCVLAEAAHAASPAGRQALDWWIARLDTLPPAPELPRAGSGDDAHFVRRSHRLEAADWQRLQARAAAAGLTASAVLLTAFAATLAGFARRPRFTLNLTLFNRPRLHPQIDQVVGDFTASLLLAHEPAAGESFAAAARRLQQRLWADLEHRAAGGVRVQRELAKARQRGGSALFPVVFTSTLGQAQPPAGARPWAAEVVWGVSQTSQVTLDHQVSEVGGALQLNWDTLEALFPPGLIARLCDEHAGLLRRLAAPDDDAAWRARDAAAPAARLQAWADYNRAAFTPAPGAPALLHQPFFELAAREPLAPAVIAHDRVLGRAELAHEALALARRLLDAGVARGDFVAIGCAKGWQQVVAAYGVLAAGAAYVPVDPALPPARRAQLLADAAARALVLADDAAGWPDALPHLPQLPHLHLAAPAGPAPLQAPEPPPARARPGDLAYLIYTSGSTGTPKGVMIDHRGALNTVRDINRRHAVGAADRVFALSSLSFDLSVYDLFGPPAAGGALVLPAPDELQQPARWPARLAAHGVTLWNTVPALLQLLLDALPAPAPSRPPLPLRRVLLSGDWIALALPGRLAAACPAARLFSLGGATEASIWSIDFPVPGVDPAWRSIPYGRPLAGQPWYVLDAQLRPCPPDVPGELHIGGIGVARGYWRRPGLSAERFVPNPFARAGERAHTTLYRTGDIGVLRQDGHGERWIEFLGREDQQVKLNGHRVELGEIEAALQRHPALSGAAAALAGTPPVLTAYVVPRLQDADGYGVLQRLAQRARDDGSQPGWRRAVPASGHVELPGAPAAPRLQRQSQRRFGTQPLPLAALAETLGALRAHRLAGAPLPKFDYPSAGHLYPLQAWLQVQPGRVEGLDGGWYVYHPGEHRLHRAVRPETGEAPYGDNRELAQGRAFGLFLVAQLALVEAGYGARARDFALLEAGHAAQALMERAAPGLGLCPLGGTDAAALHAALGLSDGEEALYALIGGAVDADAAQRWQAAQPAPEAAPLHQRLQRWLAERLPAYMLPARYVVLPALPLTGNGKLDRAALPAPAGERAPWRGPRNDTEARVLQLWQQMLKLEQVGPDDDFFALGGQSLAALQLLGALQQAFAVPLTLAELLGALTPAAQAELVERKRAAPPAEADVDVAALADHEVDAMLGRLLAQGES